MVQGPSWDLGFLWRLWGPSQGLASVGFRVSPRIWGPSGGGWVTAGVWGLTGGCISLGICGVWESLWRSGSLRGGPGPFHTLPPPFPQEDPSGTFVQLRLGLAQTACRKRAPQRHCRVLEGRVRGDPGDVSWGVPPPLGHIPGCFHLPWAHPGVSPPPSGHIPRCPSPLGHIPTPLGHILGCPLSLVAHPIPP